MLGWFEDHCVVWGWQRTHLTVHFNKCPIPLGQRAVPLCERPLVRLELFLLLHAHLFQRAALVVCV